MAQRTAVTATPDGEFESIDLLLVVSINGPTQGSPRPSRWQILMRVHAESLSAYSSPTWIRTDRGRLCSDLGMDSSNTPPEHLAAVRATSTSPGSSIVRQKAP